MFKRSAHAAYELQYHFVWAPKYRRQIGKIPGVRKFLEDLYPKVAEAYDFKVIEENIQDDHVHLFVEAPPKLSPAQMADVLKSISAREVFKKFPNVKRVLWGGTLWADGYFVRAVGDKVTSFIIQRYIKYQHHEHTVRQQKLF